MNKLIEMFQRVVIQKNASLIPEYYHRDFLLYTNGRKMDYDAFLAFHEEAYATSIQYAVEYDEETFVEQRDKIAARIWITVSRSGEIPKKLEIILIVTYREGKIYRMWKLTYPDWSQLSAFK